jgi:RNA polymerase sigma factor (sigma-70 family)
MVAAVAGLGAERPLSLRGWLRGILRNVSSASRRKERHRRERELTTGRNEEVPSALELLERASVQRNLVSVLLELEEPYRTTLLLKYFEELPNERIAERLGVSASTVATRAARGLERMRERLRSRFPGDEKTWLAALIPLRSWALRTANPVLGGTSTALFMSTQIKILVSIGAVVGAFFMVRGFATGPQPARAALGEPTVEAPAELERAEQDPPPLVSAPVAATERERVATPVVTEVAEELPVQAAGRVVRGRVIDLNGRPLGGLEVVAARNVLSRDKHGRRGATLASREDQDVFARGRTGNDGGFEFTVTEQVGTVLVWDERYTTVVASGLTGDASNLVVVAAWRLPLAGIVVNEAGEPVAGAVMNVRAPEETLNALGVVLDRAAMVDMTARSADDGSFSIGNAAEVPGGFLTASAPAYDIWIGQLPAGGDEHLRIVLAQETSFQKRLTGKVLEPGGDPALGAYVCFGAVAVDTDAEGRFSLDPDHPAVAALPQDAPLVLRAHLDGFAPAEHVLLSPNEAKERGWPSPTLILGARDEMLAIRGRVVDQDGEPMSNVTVHLLDKTPFGQVAHGPSRQMYYSTDVESLVHGRPPQAETDERGEFHLDGLLERSYRLQAIEEGSMISVTTEPIAAGSSAALIRIDRSQVGVIAGRLVDRDGKPVPHVNISASRSVEGMGIDFGARGASDEDGYFRLEGTTTSGVTLSLNGDAIVPEMKRALPEDEDLENLELIVGRRCHVQFEWASWQEQGLALYALDGDDEEIWLVQIREGMWSVMPMAIVTGELSEVFVLPDTAAAVVLKRGADEVARIPLDLTPGDVQRVEI